MTMSSIRSYNGAVVLSINVRGADAPEAEVNTKPNQ
jgi:hypothetical protein